MHSLHHVCLTCTQTEMWKHVCGFWRNYMLELFLGKQLEHSDRPKVGVAQSPKPKLVLAFVCVVCPAVVLTSLLVSDVCFSFCNEWIKVNVKWIFVLHMFQEIIVLTELSIHYNWMTTSLKEAACLSCFQGDDLQLVVDKANRARCWHRCS